MLAVLSYDEKPGIQALSNSAPDRPPVPGRHATLARDHEYVRHGTVSLLAGIDLLSGHVHGFVRERHRSREFIEFLRAVNDFYPPTATIRIVLDNHSAHISRETRAYLDTVPNGFEFVFTPKHGSWLNLVESFFAKLAKTLLRAIRVSSKEELCHRIEQHLADLNREPVAMLWQYGRAGPPPVACRCSSPVLTRDHVSLGRPALSKGHGRRAGRSFVDPRPAWRTGGVMNGRHGSWLVLLVASVAPGCGDGRGDAETAPASAPAFTVNDIAVGDPGVSYANVEFTADGRYLVWIEGTTDGSGDGTVWHCAVNRDTGELDPPDGKGFRAFDSTLLGRANPGRDAGGAYYVGLDRTGRLILVRPTSATSGEVTALPTTADITRRSIYPTDLPNARGGDVFWIKNQRVAGSGLDPRNDWFELRYLDLADPATEHVIERQDKPARGFAAMDIGFARWFREKAALTYGFFDVAGQVQVREYAPGTAAPLAVTNDPYSKIDPFPFVFQSDDWLIAGIDGTATTQVYRRPAGVTSFSLAETIYPKDSRLAQPALAQSNERIVYAGGLYTAYQVNERGSGFVDTAFAQTGEIWLSTVGQSPQREWRLSEVTDTAKAEPEPLVGTNRVWVYYSALPRGGDPAAATWRLRRADTPLAAGSSSSAANTGAVVPGGAVAQVQRTERIRREGCLRLEPRASLAGERRGLRRLQRPEGCHQHELL